MIKKEFLKKEFIISSINAAFQRNKNVYKDSADKWRCEEFRLFLNLFLKGLPEVRLTEEDLYSHISGLIEETKKYDDILKLGQLNYGTAQKLVNLYLKYLWCSDFVPEPPHCPIDRIILKEAGILDVAWTGIADRDEYVAIVNRIKGVCGNMSLAQWELQSYNRR